MDNYSLIVFGTIIILILILIVLSQLFKNLVRKQIDDQLKNMIPIKAIRKKVGIRIKFRQ